MKGKAKLPSFMKLFQFVLLMYFLCEIQYWSPTYFCSRLIIHFQYVNFFLQNVHLSHLSREYIEKHCGKLETSTAKDSGTVVINY